ncbi:MAG: hypothetical protein MI924_15325 [Chloroflexales bacterium]|nr:hypothetical protein [Chloroflexales bacterium]
MRLHTHVWTSMLTACAIYPRSLRNASLLILAGVLIDLDHLVLYSLRTGDLSVSGAVAYDRYRGSIAVPGDTRPRYGSLRSWLHQPLLTLPLVWLLSRRWSSTRPVALGITLHLILDYALLPIYWLIHQRARGRCEVCLSGGRKLQVWRNGRAQVSWQAIPHDFVALCPDCYDRAKGYK